MLIRPNNLRNLLPVLEKYNRRHGPNAQLLCNVGYHVHVYLVELGCGVGGAELVDFGSDGLAGAAPFGPGVEDDGVGGVEDFGDEFVFATRRAGCC